MSDGSSEDKPATRYLHTTTGLAGAFRGEAAPLLHFWGACQNCSVLSFTSGVSEVWTCSFHSFSKDARPSISQQWLATLPTTLRDAICYPSEGILANHGFCIQRNWAIIYTNCHIAGHVFISLLIFLWSKEQQLQTQWPSSLFRKWMREK